MSTLVLGEQPAISAWLAERRRLGQDRYDEIWEGVYHVAPAPTPAHGDVDDQLARLLGPHADRAGLRGHGTINVGAGKDDFRVPDHAYLRGRPTTTFVPSAAVVVEIVSPDDETWAKLDFYFAHGVEELLVVDPQRREVTWLVRGPSALEPAAGSALLGLTAAELAGRLDWPPL